ncbi:MAG: hypothetical protein V4579_03420 [Pseudomonadota bacterium]
MNTHAACSDPPVSSALRWACGSGALDAVLGGGLERGRVHEFYAAETADAAAAKGFVMAVATGISQRRGAVLWLRSRRAITLGGELQASGWAELGGTPGTGLLGTVADTITQLRTAVDALRCPALGAVVVEGWGAMRELDLTATRRLALTAAKSGVPLLLLRIDAEPIPSAAQTRWQVAAAPSHALPGQAPGLPTFDITLLRQRSGPAGFDWRLEWDRDQRKFRETAVSGAVVSVPVGRPVADPGTGSPGPHRRHAA